MKTLIKRVRDNFCVGRKTEVLLSLFVLSLCVRLAFFLPVAISDVRPDYDEIIYYDKAVNFQIILTDILHGRAPEGEPLRRVYGSGWWLPLHPALCGLGLLFFGKSVAAARLVVALISAVTTPLVFLLTLRLASKKAAFIAALIHIFYPSFIAYSHYLWSETTYIFMLLLAVYFTILTLYAGTARKKMTRAALSGFFLGLCGLTRAAALPFLVIVPCWSALVLKGRVERVLLPGIIMLVSIVVISPWEYALMSHEERFVPLSRSGAFGLYMGNNPWVPTEIGSSQGVAAHRHRATMEEEIRQYMEAHHVDRGTAETRLALREISGDYRKFFVRCCYRLRMLWSNDNNVLRHILHANYPPLPHAFAAAIFAVVSLGYIALMGFAASGFFTSRPLFQRRSLLLFLILGGMAPPIFGIAVPRFHLPLLALMLPAAGVGVVNLKAIASSARVLLVALLVLVVCAFCLTTFHMKLSNFICPSSYYMGLIGRVDRMFGASTLYTDIVVFRARDGVAPPGKIRMRLLNEGSRFHRPDGIECEWDTGKERVRRVIIRSREISGPLRISIFSPTSGKASVIEPIRPQCWWEWQPAGIDGIEYKWAVSGSFDPN